MALLKRVAGPFAAGAPVRGPASGDAAAQERVCAGADLPDMDAHGCHGARHAGLRVQAAHSGSIICWIRDGVTELRSGVVHAIPRCGEGIDEGTATTNILRSSCSGTVNSSQVQGQPWPTGGALLVLGHMMAAFRACEFSRHNMPARFK